MAAATFILTINVFAASVFSACFSVVHLNKRQRRGENWFAWAFGLIALHGLLEFAQPFLPPAEPGNFFVFLVYLCAMVAMVTGLTRRFAMPTRPMLLIGLIGIGIPAYLGLLGLDRQDPVRPFLYQAPFVLVQLIGCWVIWRSIRDRLGALLLASFAASAVIFAGKPVLADALGIGPSTQSFLSSDYGAFSLMFEAFFLISTGVLLMIAIACDLLFEVTQRSETDTLSGLLNRRGFDERSARAIEVAQERDRDLVLILADLDHFKAINDRFGHAMGDRVIAIFGRLLRRSARAANEVIIGRLGGEEFAILMSGNIVDGRNYGEVVRRAFADLTVDEMGPQSPITASFGVAELQTGESMFKLMERADAALYEAKNSGRNRVHVGRTLSIVRKEWNDGAVR